MIKGGGKPRERKEKCSDFNLELEKFTEYLGKKPRMRVGRARPSERRKRKRIEKKKTYLFRLQEATTMRGTICAMKFPADELFITL